MLCDVEKAEKASGSLRHMMRSVGRSVGRGALGNLPGAMSDFGKPLRAARPMRTVVDSGFNSSSVVEGGGVEDVKYEWYRLGSACLKYSSSGPRLAQGSVSVSLIVESRSADEEAESAECVSRIAQRQCVRVGAAMIAEGRRKRAESSASDEGSEDRGRMVERVVWWVCCPCCMCWSRSKVSFSQLFL